MKKVLVLTLILFCTVTFAQKITDTPNGRKVIYKGFEVGMTKSEAKAEFNRDKEAYKNIDLKNGCNYLVFPPYFEYDNNNKLVGIALFSDTGTALRKSEITKFFDKSKEFFKEQGYQITSISSNTTHLHHINMDNADKNTVIEMFSMESGPFWFVNIIRIYNRDEVIKKAEQETKMGKNETPNDTGF